MGFPFAPAQGFASSGAPVLTGAVYPVAVKATNYSLLAADSFGVFSNAGAVGSVTLTLPTAAAGLTYQFVVEAAQSFVIAASGGATVRLATVASAGNGNATANAIGNTLHLVATSNSTWVATFFVGTWTVT